MLAAVTAGGDSMRASSAFGFLQLCFGLAIAAGLPCGTPARKQPLGTVLRGKFAGEDGRAMWLEKVVARCPPVFGWRLSFSRGGPDPKLLKPLQSSEVIDPHTHTTCLTLPVKLPEPWL